MSLSAPHPLDERLEPEATMLCDEQASLVSIAVSLKRIADALAGTNTNISLLELIADRLHQGSDR